MSESNFSKGSEWRKWDLHVHSPLSVLNNRFPKLESGHPDWETFLAKLESLDVAVLGITDYFSIEGYKELQEFRAQGRLKNISAILPNIEFRLKTIITARNGDEKRLNLHVIFSDQISTQDIEEHFLHDILFYYQGNPQERSESRKLKLSNIESLGNELMKQHARFQQTGASPLELGVMQAVVDHEDILKRLEDSRFKGKYVVVLAAEGWDQISWDGQAHLTRKALLQTSDMVFSSNLKTRKWCLGCDPYTEGIESFINEFKTLKPCIHGSDAHRIEDVGRPCAKRGDQGHNCDTNTSQCDLRYCWIKADPTFEGLKQLLYEPEDRVSIQSSNPTPVISAYSITKLSIVGAVVNDELSVADANLDLNPFLVAVVGGKGAGKTALVDLVANCYMDRATTDDSNSFVRRVTEYDPDLKITLCFRDGGEFTKRLADKTIYEDGQIIYIAQGELERYIGEKSDLHQRIQELIFNSPQIKNSVLSFEFDSGISVTKAMESKLAVRNRTIEELEELTSDANAKAIEHDEKTIKADIKDITKRIEEIEKTQDKASTEIAKKKQEALGNLKSRQENLLALRDASQSALDLLENQILEFNRTIETVNELMRTLNLPQKGFPELSYPPRSDVEKTLEIATSQIKQHVANIEKEQKELENLERGVKEHAKFLEQRRERQTALRAVEKKVKQLTDNKSKLSQIRQDRAELLKQLMGSLISQKKQYDTIIKTFSDKKDAILSDIDFVAEIHIDDESLLKAAEEVLDNRRVVIRGDDKTKSVFVDLIRLGLLVAEGDESKINEYVAEIERCNKELKQRVKGAPVTTGDFFEMLYRNYMQVIPVVKYKKTNIEKLSLGQKATVLIKIYLAYGDKPIIIDSHDDHLDNEFIMEELIKAIRQAKNFRQVILVSNNGNVVINSDAEQIVLATRDAGKISYAAGSIENPSIRDRALKVLEGGPEAFRKRQQKYRLGA